MHNAPKCKEKTRLQNQPQWPMHACHKWAFYCVSNGSVLSSIRVEWASNTCIYNAHTLANGYFVVVYFLGHIWVWKEKEGYRMAAKNVSFAAVFPKKKCRKLTPPFQRPRNTVCRPFDGVRNRGVIPELGHSGVKRNTSAAQPGEENFLLCVVAWQLGVVITWVTSTTSMSTIK